MSRLNTALHNDIQALKLVRDELLLQSKLLAAEARDQWSKLEADWDLLKEHLCRAQTAADSALPEIEAAASQLSESLKRGYAEIRRALKR
jgi:hypothetical protein